MQKTTGFTTNKVTIDFSFEGIKSEKVHIWNLFDSVTYKVTIDQMISESIRNIASAYSLLENKGTIFTKLSFCDCVEGQLRDIPRTYIPAIVEHLRKMDEYCKQLECTPEMVPNYKNMGMVASTESDQTLYHFGDYRTFLCPDGVERLFNWHLKLGSNIRIHFFPAFSDRSNILVGYIGVHLPTWTDQH